MGRLIATPPNFADCLTVGQAAEFLGVSTATLRNWDRSGKLKPRRHPQNGYRIYLHEDLELVLRSADLATTGKDAFAPQVDWTKMRENEHFVQFYDSDAYLIDSVSGFVAASLNTGGTSVVVATLEHRNVLQRMLVASGIDVAAAIECGRYVVLDAEDVLAKIMFDGMPEPTRFMSVIGETLALLSANGGSIHAFGEMVALLWARGDRDAAIRLEELWNEISKQYRFTLFCAYPISAFNDLDQALAFDGVCSCHSQVIPAESYSALDKVDKRMRAVSVLQQQAASLEAEIEHRREVERALSQRERELADFFDNAVEGLHKVGADGTILWANSAEYSMLGYTAEEFIGHPITEFHADAEVIADILDRLQKGETLINHPARLRCKDGAIKHVLINSNACIEDGKLCYTRCFTRDVTRQWLAEKALLDADRRKDEFLATLSHELRNPLAPIRNALELLEQGEPNAAILIEGRRVIRRQVEQMTRLVDDLLDVSRITGDKIELRTEVVDLADIIESAVETSRPAIDAAGHTLIVSLPETPLFLEVDPGRMAQVFSNLLNNAAKYTNPGGRIEVQAKRNGSDVVVGVHDNGIGISGHDLAYVFDMFRQADHTLEKSHGGLGIGLTLVRRLVELLGGSVNAQSEGPGKGSKFTVRLPAAKGKKPGFKVRPNAVTKPAEVKRRILVVDDNLDSGGTLSLLLKVRGHEVATAKDGSEAIKLAAEFRPQIVLMDIGMPNMNGYEATRRIRNTEHGKDIFIVALTGWSQPSDIARSLEAGCSAHLAKPVDFVALESLLATAKIV